MEKLTDVPHVVDTVTAVSQANQIAKVETTLSANPPGKHKSLSDLWPVIRPALSLLSNIFPSTSVWHHALVDFISVGDNELTSGTGNAKKATSKNKGTDN